MKNIYITGGLGQDGIILTKKFYKKKKFRLFLYDKKNKKINKNQKKILINNEKVFYDFFSKKPPDVIIHLAANNPSFGEKSFKKFYLKNLRFTKNIVTKAKFFNSKVKVIFANSSQIFKVKNGTVNENSNYKITSHYTRFRIETIKLLDELKINYTNLILFNHDSIYRKKKFLIPRIIFALKNNNKKFIQGIIKKNIHGDFSHAEDICNAIYKVSISNKKINNLVLSSNKCTSLNKLIVYLINKNKLKMDYKFNSLKKITCLKGENLKAMKLLNWRPKKNIFLAAQEMFNLK